jgi:hypothetical protein
LWEKVSHSVLILVYSAIDLQAKKKTEKGAISRACAPSRDDFTLFYYGRIKEGDSQGGKMSGLELCRELIFFFQVVSSESLRSPTKTKGTGLVDQGTLGLLDVY